MQWICGDDLKTYRLPPRGPTIPVASLILFMVTEDHHFKAYYPRPHGAPMVLTSPLQMNSYMSESKATILPSVNGNRRCTFAAIGLGYNGYFCVILRTRCSC